MFTVRRATIDDLDALVQLRLRLFREVDLAGSEPSLQLIEATRMYLLTHLPTERFMAWVAETEGQIGILLKIARSIQKSR
ncbi:MAG: hypothetical protein H0U76_13060 [Ktedonobacteraceae bacterium]|nr:hypothetical protein [Ktedonobacteraceae bacterium]